MAATLLLLSAGCATIEVKHNFDPTYDFKPLRSFMLTNSSVWSGASRFDSDRLRAEIVAELVRKGFQETISNPDFLVAFRTGTRTSVHKEWQHSQGLWWTETDEVSVEGRLVLDVIDRATQQIRWSGSMQGVMAKDPSPQTRARNIRRAVRKLLAKFPPR